ncbi:MAG: hypothetical protein RBG13Loki_3889 [Promethearchaeota archaeon CR_4]|nr:MAG: hypothetical protein RBG13Loki_3889 [Candidatus Lokiarchaeota archaeon CR_4]
MNLIVYSKKTYSPKVIFPDTTFLGNETLQERGSSNRYGKKFSFGEHEKNSFSTKYSLKKSHLAKMEMEKKELNIPGWNITMVVEFLPG